MHEREGMRAVLHLFLVVPGCTDVCVCMLVAWSHAPPLQTNQEPEGGMQSEGEGVKRWRKEWSRKPNRVNDGKGCGRGRGLRSEMSLQMCVKEPSSTGADLQSRRGGSQSPDSSGGGGVTAKSKAGLFLLCRLPEVDWQAE